MEENPRTAVQELRPYFEKPVVVQLKVPTVAIGNDGTMIDTPDGPEPLPKLEAKPNEPAVVLNWLVGVLTPAPDGTHVLLTINSPVHNARTRYRLSPADIQYLMMVVRPGVPVEQGRIVSPH